MPREAGLMEKEIKAEEYTAKLAQMTSPSIEARDGYANYTPADVGG